MAFGRNPLILADGTFSATGTTAWNTQIFGVTDAVSGGIPYFSSTTAEGTSALLAAGGVVLGGGAGNPPLTSTKLSESSTAGAGLTIAAGTATTDVNALSITQTWNNGSVAFTSLKGVTTLTAQAVLSNYIDWRDATGTVFRVTKEDAVGNTRLFLQTAGQAVNQTISLETRNANTGAATVSSANTLNIGTGAVGNTLQLGATAGLGLAIVAGTATTDVNALSITQTWNASGVTFVGKDINITNTASAAGALIERWRVGGTVMASLSKAGLYDAVAYSVGGTAGADFGPGLPTSITVVKGIITAIS